MLTSHNLYDVIIKPGKKGTHKLCNIVLLHNRSTGIFCFDFILKTCGFVIFCEKANAKNTRVNGEFHSKYKTFRGKLTDHRHR